MDRAVGTPGDPGPAAGTTGGVLGGSMLDGQDSGLVPDLVSLVDQIGGTATASRTMLYPAVAGFSQSWAVNLGANLADFTGGGHNTGPGDLSATIDAAGRGCACIYRIGLLAPEGNKSKVYRTKVKVRGRALPSRYRVQYLSPADRWVRKAQAVLSNPDEVSDIGIVAALVPTRVQGRDWKLKAQVSVDANSLQRLQTGENETGEWEVGALLANAQGTKTWEVLAVSRLRIKDEDEIDPADISDDPDEDAIILHEHAFEGLKPGRYELRAFVRDRAANHYRGDRADIDLPHAEQPGLAGPVMLRPKARHLRTSLPITGKQNAKIRWLAVLETGSLPLGNTEVEVGDRLEFVTLVCPARPKEEKARLHSSVLADDETVLPLDRTKIDRAGDCVELRDRLDTEKVAAGSYTYRVRWDRGAGQAPMVSEKAFEMIPKIVVATEE
jgi:hypothetical protein